jgi:RNA polymerase sigma-70 factor (ECF subfamily)
MSEADFSRLVDRHRPQILAYCLRRTSASDADDAAADVFAVAWRRRDDMPRGSDALPWLYGVARNVVKDQWRGARRRRNLVARAIGRRDPRPKGPEDVVVEHEDYLNVRAALDRLADSDREVLRLSAWEGLTYSEIAAVTGSTLAAVDKRVARAKQRLARQYAVVTQVSMRSSAGNTEGGGGR